MVHGSSNSLTSTPANAEEANKRRPLLNLNSCGQMTKVTTITVDQILFLCTVFTLFTVMHIFMCVYPYLCIRRTNKKKMVASFYQWIDDSYNQFLKKMLAYFMATTECNNFKLSKEHIILSKNLKKKIWMNTHWVDKLIFFLQLMIMVMISKIWASENQVESFCWFIHMTNWRNQLHQELKPNSQEAIDTFPLPCSVWKYKKKLQVNLEEGDNSECPKRTVKWYLFSSY